MAKRRTKGEGSVHQRPDGRWVASINVAPDGMPRKRRVVYGTTKPEVMRKLGEVKDEAKRGNRNSRTMTVKAWSNHWFDKVCAVRPGTKTVYRRTLDHYILPSIGGVRLDTLNSDHVERLHEHMAHLSPTTIQNAHRLTGNIINQAVARGLGTRNPFKSIPAPKRQYSDRRALTEREVDDVFLEAAKDRIESRWLTALLLGLRQGEALGLTWDRVDVDNGMLDLGWQMQRIPYRHGCDLKPCGFSRAGHCPRRVINADRRKFKFTIIEGNLCWVQPKTGTSRRVVPIPPELVGPLRRQWVAYLEAKQSPDFHNHNLVWAHENGRPFDGREDYRAWRALLASADVDPIPLHGARHTAATILLRKGVDSHVVSAILGHSDILTTQGYQHADVTMAREALSRPRAPSKDVAQIATPDDAHAAGEDAS